jgi:WD40 repeat protein
MVLEGHTGLVNALAVLPEGRLASGSLDGAVRVWDLAAGTAHVLKGHTDRVNALAVLPDGSLASGSNDYTVSTPVTPSETAAREHSDNPVRHCLI